VGTFLHPITLIGPSDDRETIEALVDTGATFTAAPRDLLSRLGVRPSRQVRLRLADGRSHVQQFGRVMIEFDGIEELTFVLFAEETAPSTIGAITLETLLLGVDPVNQQLIPGRRMAGCVSWRVWRGL
jgi:clan AA aspartic protease